MDRTKKDNAIEDKVKFSVLAILSFSILIGSFVLFWQMQKQNEPKVASGSNEELMSEVESLNNKIDSLSKALEGAKTTEEQTVVTEVDTTTYKEERVAGVSSANQGSQPSQNSVPGLVNINTASASQLDSLPGIGPAYAQRIIDYRNANGGFKSLEEIQNIKGIGPKTFEKLKNLIAI